MKPASLLACIIFFVLLSCGGGQGPDSYQLPIQKHDLRLWYEKPAKEWNEALPIGNGRLGAMVHGRVEKELITLNEESLWTGGPKARNNPNALKVLPLVRKAIFDRDYQKADSLCMQMQGPFTQSYAPMGNLEIDFETKGEVRNYYRDLNLESALANITYTTGEGNFKREIFASYPDQLIVMRLTCDTPGKISFTAGLNSLLRYSVRQEESNLLIMDGKCPKHADPDYLGEKEDAIIYAEEADGEGMTFSAQLEIRNVGGQIVHSGQNLGVKNADEVVLLFSAGTSFNGFNKSPGLEGKDPQAIARKHLAAAKDKTFEEMKESHIQSHQLLFNRVILSLEEGSKVDKPTDQRIKSEETDLHLEELLFQYGRYLLISSSRPDGVPANLQGIWSHKLRPPWSDNFTSNINVQMNYWPAEATNLSELHEPFLRFIEDLAENGSETASTNYGTNGWCLHHNTDIWASTNPVGNYGTSGVKSIRWANFAMGSPWVCQHLWEHYQFTEDKEFLKNKAYPLMKGAAEFVLDWLIEDPDGYLVTVPSTSPENVFITDEGVEAQSQMGSEIDRALAYEIFANCIKSATILGIDEEFISELTVAQTKLTLPKIGKHGQLQEWYYDWDKLDDKHRHISHLYSLHPGDQISPLTTPDLAAACKKSLEMRGDEGTGWSLAWKINTWARLFDGNHAHSLIKDILRYVDPSNYKRGGHEGGSYPNLLGACPPFMIEGNFGTTAGMAEMLLQSHQGELHLLPALPDAWSKGHITGLRARGGFTVDIYWDGHQLTKAVVRGEPEKMVKFRFRDKVKSIEIPAEGFLVIGIEDF